MSEASTKNGVTPDLDRREREDAEGRVAIKSGVVHEAIRLEGEEELERSTTGLLFSGLAAGLSMGFSMVAQGILRAMRSGRSWSPRSDIASASCS